MKENTSIFTTIIVLTLALSACNTEKKNESSNDSPQESTSAKVEAIQSDNFTFKDESIKSVFQNYMKLRSDLTNSNAEKASISAQSLVDVLAGVSDITVVNESADLIANSKDIAAQRIAFSTLSEAMIEIVSGNITSGEVYLAHCPMAMDNVGANWITTTKDILNPYFGDMMLKCGSITKSITMAE